MQLTSCPIHLMLSQCITGRGTEKKTTTYLHAALYHSSEMFTCGPPQTVPDPHEPSCLHQRVTGCWRDVFSPGRCLAARLRSAAELWKRHQRASTSCSHFSGFHLTIRFNYNCENIWGALGVPAPWWRRFLLCWGSSWCGCPSLVSAESV